MGERRRYVVALSDALSQRSEVLGLGVRNSEWLTDERYAKYYVASPMGVPTLLLAREQSSDRAIGMTSIYPSCLRIDGKLVPGGIIEDFYVDADHRGLVPALLLQRSAASHTLEESKTHEYLFAMPNPAAAPVLRRAGYVDLGNLMRFTKVMRARLLGRRYFPDSHVRRIALLVAGPLLAMTSADRRLRRSTKLTVTKSRSFNAGFEPLWDSLNATRRVVVERTPELMNWRYDLEPSAAESSRYSLFTVHENDKIVGYVVFIDDDNIRSIVDIITRDSKPAIDSLLSELVQDARRNAIAGITILYVGAPSLLTNRLRAFGFLSRPSGDSLFVNVKAQSQIASVLTNRENWYFFARDSVA